MIWNIPILLMVDETCGTSLSCRATSAFYKLLENTKSWDKPRIEQMNNQANQRSWDDWANPRLVGYGLKLDWVKFRVISGLMKVGLS